MLIERPTAPAARLRQVIGDFGGTYALNGLIGFIFAATGPVAVILSVVQKAACHRPSWLPGCSARSSSTGC